LPPIELIEITGLQTPMPRQTIRDSTQAALSAAIGGQSSAFIGVNRLTPREARQQTAQTRLESP
jgi:hypothetical protein